MTSQQRADDPHQARVLNARKRFFAQNADDGDLISGIEDVLTRPVLLSWQRCLSSGLDWSADGRNEPEGRSVLTEARDRNERLLRFASDIMEHLFEQIRASGSMVILADNQGMILHGLGDPDFFSRAQRVALQPGSSWSESLRGTNAIGTALKEAAPIEIIGAEHFFVRNNFLTCSAAPLLDHEGQMLGVLDISADYRGKPRHTLGLVRLAAQMIERRLFEVEFAGEVLVSLHIRSECVGGPQEGLLALSADGHVLGANAVARGLLAEPKGLLGQDFSTLFRQPFGPFADRARRNPFSLQSLETRGGTAVQARLLSMTPQRLIPSSKPARATSSAATQASSSRGTRLTLDSLATGDANLQTALKRAKRIIGKDIPLLIQGESGVGKELFAQAFHCSGPRREGPFVALNCAAIPENLIESELFGYAGGAFTGARREGSIGKIQQAHGGTLFLDEIGDMPLTMQARLLRVLQERCVVPVGSQNQVPVDISLVCATHRVLRDAIRAGSFREDLYYRVNGLTVTIPALRERSDIRRIVKMLVETEAGDGKTIQVHESAMELFERHPWPGNVRQLHNVIRLAVALLDEDESEIQLGHLSEDLFGPHHREESSGERPRTDGAWNHSIGMEASGRSLDEIKHEAIIMAMNEVEGNVSAAARRLGISRNTLYRRIGRMK